MMNIHVSRNSHGRSTLKEASGPIGGGGPGGTTAAAGSKLARMAAWLPEAARNDQITASSSGVGLL